MTSLNSYKYIGITDFSMVTPLGNNLTEISENIFNNNLAMNLIGMKADNSYLNGENTVIGKVNCDFLGVNKQIKELTNEYNYRAIYMTLQALDNIKDSIEKLL